MAKFSTVYSYGIWHVKPYGKRLSAFFQSQFRPQGQDMACAILRSALRY